jgi:hypothetical protein
VSGRRKHPTPPPAGSPTALAGRLSDGDRQVCRLLAEHQVLTTGLLAVLLDLPPRTLQQRLATLTLLRIVDRFRPRQTVGAGSAPYHYLLGDTGAASSPPIRPPRMGAWAGIGRGCWGWRMPTDALPTCWA